MMMLTNMANDFDDTHLFVFAPHFSSPSPLLLHLRRSFHNTYIEAKKNYTLRPRVVLPDSYVKGE